MSSGTGSSNPGSDRGGFVPPSTDDLDAILDQYEFLALLGRGGMGAVYKARQKSLDRLVAIKILPPQLTQDTEGDADFHFAERFQREAKAMAKLSHPHIVAVYDFGQAKDGQFYFVMEYVEGTDLGALIKGGQMTVVHVTGWMSQICDALQYAHGKGIVHRDIKPANIMITSEGQVKVADFGLAKLAGGDAVETKLTMTNMAMGTPDYVAPEALEMGVEIDHRADLYALGVMLYEMLTGRVPRGKFKPPSAAKTDLDPRFDDLVAKAMEADREDRHQMASDISATLYQIATTPLPEAPVGGRRTMVMGAPPLSVKESTRPQRLAPVSRPKPSPPPARSKSPVGLIAGIVVSAVVVGFLGFFLFKSQTDPTPSKTESPVSRAAPAQPPLQTDTASDGKSPPPASPVPAPPPVSPAAQPSTVPGNSGTPPAVTASPKETLDLLSMIDLEQDTVHFPGITGQNKWYRENGELRVTDPQRKGAKVVAPVSLEATDYEYEVVFQPWNDGKNDDIARLFNVDVFLEKNLVVMPVEMRRDGTVYLPDGDELRLGGGVPRFDGQGPYRLRLRVTHGSNGVEDRLRVLIDDQPAIDWIGRFADRGKKVLPNAAFPDAYQPGLWVHGDGISFAKFSVAIYEGEALKLRPAAGAPPPSAVTTAPGGAVANLLEGIVIGRDAVAGGWSNPGGELHGKGNTGYDKLAFPNPVPGEYDFRVVFTRTEGQNSVAQHLVLPNGQTVMWIMGGFGNKVFALEQLNGEGGDANPTTVNLPLENGRRYESVVKVRRDHITAELDGKVLLDFKTAGNQLAAYEKWKFPDPKKLGVGCQQPTEFHRVEMIPFTDHPVATAPVVHPPTTPATTAPVPSTDPRLARLEASFKSRYDTEAQKPYAAALATLNQSYVANGIARARATAQQKGVLDEVIQLDAEAKRIQSNEGLPPADLDSLPASLKTLRGTYRTALSKIESDRAKKAAPLYDLYLGALDSYIAELTKANKITEARQVKTLRDQVAAQKGALIGDAVSAAAPIAPAPPVGMVAPKTGASAPPENVGTALPIPPEALAPTEKGRYTKELIEWVTKRGNHRLGFSQGNNRTTTHPANVVLVPTGATLWLIDNSNQGIDRVFDAAWLEGQTDLEELHLFGLEKFSSPLPLRGMKKLRLIRLNARTLTEEQMLQWPPLPALASLEIEAAFSNQGLRILCERCPELTRLSLNGCSLTEGGLLPLQHLKNLTYFNHQRGTIPPGELAAFASLPKLDTLELRDMSLTGADFSSLVKLTGITTYNARLGDAEAKTLSSLKSLVRLSLYIGNITDDSLPVFGTLMKLQLLDLSQNAINGSTLASLGELKNLTDLRLANTQISDATIAGLPALPGLTKLSISGNTAIGDAAAAAIAKQRNLTELNVIETGIGDTGLQTLCNDLPNLIVLWLNGTKVTDSGIPALKRLKGIQRLELRDTGITDASVEHLKKLVTLKNLLVARTKITPGGIAELEEALPQCQVISK